MSDLEESPNGGFVEKEDNKPGESSHAEISSLNADMKKSKATIDKLTDDITDLKKKHNRLNFLYNYVVVQNRKILKNSQIMQAQANAFNQQKQLQQESPLKNIESDKQTSSELHMIRLRTFSRCFDYAVTDHIFEDKECLPYLSKVYDNGDSKLSNSEKQSYEYVKTICPINRNLMNLLEDMRVNGNSTTIHPGEEVTLQMVEESFKAVYNNNQEKLELFGKMKKLMKNLGFNKLFEPQ